MVQDWLERLRAFWRTSRRNQIIVAASVVVVIALVLGGVALANRGGVTAGAANPSGPSHGLPQATSAAPPPNSGSAGTPQPTFTPLPTKPVNRAFVGGTAAGFTAVYGRPTSTGVDSGNNLPTVTYKGSGPIGSITIELDHSRSYVVGVVVSAAANTPWDANTVDAIYPHFAPSDTTYDPAQSITNGSNQDVALFLLGHSPLLASTLPASVFTDNQGQGVAGGTFSTEIYYINGSDGRLAYACSVRLGNQPVSPATS